MINYQGVQVSIYAFSKTDPKTVKVKYETHVHHAGCEGREHCGIATVKVEDLVVQSFDQITELATALRKSPFFFDKDGFHTNDSPVEIAEEVVIPGAKPKAIKKIGGSKYNIHLEQLKEHLGKGHKKSEICKMFEVPAWYLDKFMKANELK